MENMNEFPLRFEIARDHEVMIQIKDTAYNELASFLLDVSTVEKAISLDTDLDDFLGLNCPYIIEDDDSSASFEISNKICRLKLSGAPEFSGRVLEFETDIVVPMLKAWSWVVQDCYGT